MSDAPNATPTWRDRSGGLRVVGGILVAIGLACAGLSAVLLLVRALFPSGRAEPVLIFSGFAAVLIILGVGSFRGRRWARDVIFIASAFTAALALLAGPFAIWLIFRMFSTRPEFAGSGGTVGCMVAAPLVFMMIAFLVLPVALLAFYGRRDVRLTVERLDPNPGWTDRQPLPVMAAALFYAWVAACSLPSLIRPVVAGPGGILTGAPARALLIGVLLVCAWIGWGLYRGSRAAWAAALAMTAGGILFSFWTLRDLDLAEIQRAAGAPEDQVDFFRGVDVTPPLIAMTLVTGAAWLAYLVWIRRYLRPAESRPAAS